MLQPRAHLYSSGSAALVMSRPADTEAPHQLPAYGIGLTARIGPAVQHSGYWVYNDATDGAGPPHPLWPPVHLVPESREGGTGLLSNPALDVQSTGVISVRLEGIRKTVAGKARRLDCLLRVHAEKDNVQESLEHCLRLDVSSGSTERHEGPAVAQRQSGVRRQAGPLSRSNTGSMIGVGPGL